MSESVNGSDIPLVHQFFIVILKKRKIEIK